MDYLDSIILGIVQGVTEFLPVSSSGHLLMMRRFLKVTGIPILYDILLHISTLIVVIIVFRSKIAFIFRALFNFFRARNFQLLDPEDRENLKLVLLILPATVVTGGIGFLISGLEEGLSANLKIVSVLFGVTAIFLILSAFRQGAGSYLQLGLRGALIIGFAQGLGVLPGISRAGITISAALLCGLDREKAGEFSFLIAIPAILGALILKLNEAGTLLNAAGPLVLGTGIVSSFLVGFLSLLLLLKIIRRGKLFLFSFYLIPLGILTFFLV